MTQEMLTLSAALDIIAALEAENRQLRAQLACHRACADIQALEEIRQAYIAATPSRTKRQTEAFND
jgi:hypothetical protein